MMEKNKSFKDISKEIPKVSVVILIEKYKFSELKKTLISIQDGNYLDKMDVHIFSKEKIEKINRDIKSFKLIKISTIKIINNFFETLKSYINILNEYLLFINVNDLLSIDYLRKMQLKVYETSSDVVISKYANIKKESISIYDSHNLYDFLQIEKNTFFDNYLETLNYVRELNCIYGKLINKNLFKTSIEQIDLVKKIKIEYLNFLLIFFIFKNAKKIEFLNGDLYFYNYKIQNKINLKNEINDIDYVFKIIKKIDLTEQQLIKIDKWKIYFYLILCKNNKNFFHEIISFLSDDEKDYFRRNYKINKPFYKLVSVTNNINELWKLKKKIYDSKIISFDVFDTLVLRNFWQPTDLFEILNYRVNELIEIKDFFDFKQIRIEAEKEARKKYKREITIDEIYEVISNQIPFLQKFINEIKNIEIEYEIKFSQKRCIAYELFSYAVFLKKQIYITSDMYLSEQVILKILNKNDYHSNDIDAIFVSSKTKKSKSDNQVWDYIINNKDVKTKDILHIGDNYHDDFLKPKNRKVNSYWLPKTTDIFVGKTKYHSSLFFRYLNSNSSISNTSSWINNFGIKTFFSLVANKFYDNPFRVTNINSDFENNPYLFGYFALGLFMISVTKWLIEIQKEKRYEIFNFNLRDGYLFKIFFDKIAHHENIKVKTNFTYFSRNSLIPILFISESSADKISFTNYFFNFFEHRKATYLIDKLKNVISEKDLNKLNDEFKDFDIKNINDLLIFIKFISENKINVDKNKFPKDQFKNVYLKKFFSDSKNSSALFDIGYSGRISSILKETFNIEFDEYYINSENDKSFQRQNKNKLNIKTFFDFVPNFRGWLREFIVSLQENGCVNFKYENKKFTEEFEHDYNNNIFNIALIKIIQKGAIDILDESLNIYGNDFKFISFRKMDLCIPLEFFYNYSKSCDRDFFENMYFENNFDWHSQTNSQNLISAIKNDWNIKYSNVSNFYKVLSWNDSYLNFSRFKKVFFYMLFDKKKLFRYFVSFIKSKIRR